jgi:hypothetical protein
VRLVDEIPAKLLDCPEIDVGWPDAFVRLGRVVRVDYATPIHGPDEDGDRLRSFAHVFSSGVEMLVPALEGDDDRTLLAVDPSIAPIVIGTVDRILVACTVDARERVICYERAHVEDDVGDVVDEVQPIGDALLAWDPETRRLITATPEGLPIAVICGGFLGLDVSGMITG